MATASELSVLSNVPIFAQQASGYTDISVSSATRDLMNVQLDTNQPQPSSDMFSIVSDPLIPDRTVTDRIGNLDPEVYDLTQNSNITKLFTALLGPSGVGGLRKQTAVARLENSFATTHFLDLDRFYGALFGIVRTHAEVMPDFGALTDDSGGLPQAQPGTVTYTLHTTSDVTNSVAAVTSTPFSLGEEFEVTRPILVSSLRYWRQTSAYTATSMAIYDMKTQAIVPGSQVTPVNPTVGPSWHTTALAAPVLLSPGRFVVTGFFPAGYPYKNSFFNPGGLMPLTQTVGPVNFLTAADATNGAQSLYSATTTGIDYPTIQAPNWPTFGVDLIFTEAATATVSGGVQFNPYTDAAGSDVWDDVHSRDASYRSRLVKFAQAIPQGGTYAGLRAAAEAILAVDCELYESWEWVDDTADHGGVVMATGYTWHQIELGFSSWGAVQRGHTWSTFAGRILTVGRTGTSNRSELLLQPKRQLRADEQFQVVRVLDRLMPAGVSLTVDPAGLAVHDPIAIRNVAADSEYWEVISKVVPNAATTSNGQSIYQQTDPGQQQPRPAFSQYQGEAWTYNNDVTQVTSYEMQGTASLTSTDYETVVYSDGSAHAYLPSDALVPGMKAAAARAACDGVLTSHPYCSARRGA